MQPDKAGLSKAASVDLNRVHLNIRSSRLELVKLMCFGDDVLWSVGSLDFKVGLPQYPGKHKRILVLSSRLEH